MSNSNDFKIADKLTWWITFSASPEYSKGYQALFNQKIAITDWWRKLLKNFDVLIIGAGSGGCLAAKTVAEAGYDVCMVDRKREEDIGDKVCGDAIGKHHFDNVNLVHPTGEELEQKIEGIKIYSPNMETVVKVKGEGVHGYLVNRQIFGQRLLKEAKDAEVTFLDSTFAVDPIMKKQYVTGIAAKDLKSGKNFEILARVVVDASGYSAVLRKRLPPEIGIEREVKNEDVEVCYREIRQVKEQISDPTFCEIYLNLQRVPGGYYWIFPKSSTKVNVGLGVAMTKGFPNPKKLFHDVILSMPFFKDSRALTGGGGHVPTRRPLSSMVGNGLLIVGDAACQVNPIHGGGIGSSMMGGTKAGEVISEALERGDMSREAMWSYNGKFMEVYGAKQAGLDIFRMLLQRLSNEEMNYGMEHHLITDEDLLKTSLGEDVKLNITEKTRRIFKGIGSMSLLRKLNSTANLMKKIKSLYRNYPSSPEGFGEWKEKVNLIIEKAKRL